MWYTAFEILVWMILAAVLGLVIGWLIWGWAATKRQSAALAAQPDTDALTARIAALVEERDDLRATVKQLTADVDAHRLEASTASARLATVAKADGDKDAAVAAAEARAADADARAAAAGSEAEAQLAECAARVAELEAAAAAPATPVGFAAVAGAAPEADDVEGLIEGIGPKIDSLLQTIGITTFRQIAGWDERAITAVEAAMGTEMAFNGRIEREDWVGQAKRLHFEKYGEQL